MSPDGTAQPERAGARPRYSGQVFCGLGPTRDQCVVLDVEFEKGVKIKASDVVEIATKVSPENATDSAAIVVASVSDTLRRLTSADLRRETRAGCRGQFTGLRGQMSHRTTRCRYAILA